VIRRNLDHSDAQHSAIVEAILAGDPPVAREAMEEHCDGTAALVRGVLG
jgi:DNA-binding FadR family transcriptional regulator